MQGKVKQDGECQGRDGLALVTFKFFGANIMLHALCLVSEREYMPFLCVRVSCEVCAVLISYFLKG